MELIAVMTTTDSLELAQTLAAALIERKQAACVQISKIESFYAWQGATQNDEEFRLLIKTVAECYHDVERTICELHSYDLPAIVAVEFDRAYAPYAEWVVDSTAEGGS